MPNYPEGSFPWHYEKMERLWEEANNLRQKIQTMDDFNQYVEARNRAKNYSPFKK